jgi:hypothetical protein
MEEGRNTVKTVSTISGRTVKKCRKTVVMGKLFIWVIYRDQRK